MKYILLFICLLSLNVKAINISEARRQPVGSIVTITGIVLNGSEFGSQRFIDDGTDAICVFSMMLSGINKGDIITVQGEIDNYHSLIEIINLTQLNVVSTSNPLPAKPILFPFQVKESYESRLIETRNVYFTATGTFTSNTGYEITDGSSTATVYIRSGTSLVGTAIPTGRVNVSGIEIQYDYTYEIQPRSLTDITNSALYIEGTPSISNITTSGFDVNWQTNSTSSSELRYGHTPLLELGTLTVSPDINHIVPVSGGNASDIYYFQCSSVSGNDTALSPLMMGITASSVPGSIRTYFNRTVNTTVASPPGNTAHYTPNAFADTIAAVINSAQQTIDICIYGFSSFNVGAIINAINNAYSSGKQVRIIYDGNNASPGITQLNSGISKLASPIANYDYNICHNKFVIADAGSSNAVVITGSTNFSDDQLNEDPNNLVVINDQSLATVYTLEFEEMWGSNGSSPDPALSRFGYYKRDNTPHQLKIGNAEVESYFSPSDNINNVIRENISNADYSFYISLLLFTKEDIATEVINKISGGIDFAGIINDTSGTSAAPVFNNIYNVAGPSLQLYDPQSNEILHHKYMIVDQNTFADPLVLTGSHNWSLTAEIENDENTLVIHDALIANQFYQEFYKRMEDNGINIGYNEWNKNGLKAYPVPADNTLCLVAGSALNDKCNVYNMEGCVVTSVVLKGNKTTINTGNLPDGIYRLHSEKGNISISFIVRH